IASIVLISFVIGRSMEINELKSDIKDKKEQKVAITKHNDKVEAKQNEQLKDINLEDVSNEADTFNELFFDWDSWAKYDKNMKTLREKLDRKSTRLNSSHVSISYAVFCLKKKR